MEGVAIPHRLEVHNDTFTCIKYIHVHVHVHVVFCQTLGDMYSMCACNEHTCTCTCIYM